MCLSFLVHTNRYSQGTQDGKPQTVQTVAPRMILTWQALKAENNPTDGSSNRTNILCYMHHLRDLRQENQRALLKNLIIMQMPFFPFYLALLNSPYGSESAQRKTRGDLTLGNRPHQNSPICGQLSLRERAHTPGAAFNPPASCRCKTWHRSHNA